MNLKSPSCSFVLFAIVLTTTIAFANTNTAGSNQIVSTNLSVTPTNLTQLLALSDFENYATTKVLRLAVGRNNCHISATFCRQNVGSTKSKI